MFQLIKNYYHLFQAILANLLYGFPANKIKLIGVTGTDGKTTTSTLIYHLLKSSGKKVALISTVAAYIGDEEISTGFHVTTPNSFQLQRLLKRIMDEGYQYCVIEATSHGLDQYRLFGINFNIGLLTNITHEHLDYHRNYQNYTKAKAKLFKNTQFAVINKEDSSFESIKKLIPKSVKLIVYALPKEHQEVIRTRFPETYNQFNCQAAIEVAKLVGISNEEIIKNITSFPGVPGRMQLVANQHQLNLIVDFAHTPNALENALKSIKQKYSKGRVIAVYGTAGLRDVTKRPMMGEIGAKYADYVIFTAEDPRTENLESIIYQMKQGVKVGHEKLISIPDRYKAIEFAIKKIAQPGDTVAVFGKGHEQSLNLDGKVETPWSDAKAISEILRGMSSR